MECTQRLECTQELYSAQTEKICPEQIGNGDTPGHHYSIRIINIQLHPKIGFLGICGSKHPIKKGPNKVGRDPQTCNIVLNLNSVSRQHAVINILNKKDFMLMDLDSANKTKLSGKTLQPYIPQPLKNGDMVQFGDIFGVFRLLEEDDDLPMTQALDIPDTPVITKHKSRVNAVTTVPESPDVSDRDDSFIVPSQPRGPQFKSTNTHHYVKPGKTISIQPIGTNKIDNVFWNSSKKSTSLNLDDSTCDLNESKIPTISNEKENVADKDIHELETQPMFGNEDNKDSICKGNKVVSEHNCESLSKQAVNMQIPNATSSPNINSMDTQLPRVTNSPSIHSFTTQMPGAFQSPTIHSLETQLPDDNLPKVCRINDQLDMQFDLYANKESDNSIYNAQTQAFPAEKENVFVLNDVNDSPSSRKSNKSDLNTSNDLILFDEIDNNGSFNDSGESQAILTDDINLPINRVVKSDPKPEEEEEETLSQIIRPCSKRNMRIESDSSTDCEDIIIVPSQNMPEKKEDDDNTDCEDFIIDPKSPKRTDEPLSTKTANFEDMPTQVIDIDDDQKPNKDTDFEDMPTQVLDIDIIEKTAQTEKENLNAEPAFEDLLTQVIDEDFTHNKHYNPQQFSEEIVSSPFKVPFNSALKAKKKELSKTPKIKPIPNVSRFSLSNVGNDKYYQNTQEIFQDLCTQKADSPEIVPNITAAKSSNKDSTDCGHNKTPNKEKEKSNLSLNISLSDSDTETKVNKFIANLSKENVKEMIGVDMDVSIKVPSDQSNGSDEEVTPVNKRPFNFMDIDLPNTQEIKDSVSVPTDCPTTISSSESDTEAESSEPSTPIILSKKRRQIPNIKIDLSKKFDTSILPTRVITRVRKPTAKLQDEKNKKISMNTLQSTLFGEQGECIDEDIIIENISRLKTINDKSKKDNSTSETNSKTKQEKIVNLNQSENEKKERIPLTKTKTVKEDLVKKSVEKDKLEIPNKSVENDKVDKPPEKVKTTRKYERKNKREPKNKNEIKESKSDTPISSTTPKQSLETPTELNKTRELNKNKQMKLLDITELPAQTNRSTRSTRATRNKNNTIADKSTSDSKSTIEKGKRKRTKATETKTSPIKELRRSTRQRPAKEKHVEVKVNKSILKKSLTVPHEQSAVYNMSSESNIESPNNLKRSLLDNSEVPNPKRTRSVVQSNMSMQATKTHYVLFTAFPYEEVKVKLEKMGAIVVTDVMQCTVLLTLQIKRTFKLLCAVGLGKPIVGPNWVQACADSNMIVDPWPYLIQDEAAEARFRFSLRRTLTGSRHFLRGHNVSSTPSVMPNASEMKLIVECSGGTWQEGGEHWVCVTCTADKELWTTLQKRGATLVTTEFILGGVLRQHLDIHGNMVK